ncbi:MAG: zinc-binding dehydrogenase [Phycisphaerae bacterium]
MFKCLSPWNVGISLDWDKCLPIAKASGFEGIDIQVDAKRPVSWYKDLLAAHGLKAGGMSLPTDFRAEQAAYDRGLAAMPAVVKHAAEVGIRRFYTWIFHFSDMLPTKANVKFHVQRLSPAAKVLADSGCSLGLEFLGPRTMREGHKYPFPRTMEHMLDLCEAVGPNVGLLLDSWHWYTSLGTVEDILSLEARQVVYVHVNDAPAGLCVDQQIDNIRDLPAATGVIDIGGFLDALRRIGYDGPVVPEPFVPGLKQLPPEQAARVVGQALDRAWSVPPRVGVKLPATMKVVATGGQKAWLVDQPVPRPQGNEVVIRLHAAPICGSNMGAFFSDGVHVNDGHEGAGEAVATAQSHSVKPGDRVVLYPLNSCGRCPDCLRGDAIYCRHRPANYGNFAQYTRIADSLCIKLPDDIDFVHASLMCCCLGPGYEALKRLAVRAFDTVMITGLGPVGLGTTALATFLGARVIAADPVEYRRNVARELGAEVVLSPDDPHLKDAVMEATGGAGLATAVDCSGRPEALRLLIDLAGIRGHVAIVGENHNPFTIRPSEDFIRKGLTLTGCWHMNRNDAPDLITFLRRCPGRADRLITHRFGLDQVQEAFDTFASGQAVKVILLPNA